MSSPEDPDLDYVTTDAVPVEESAADEAPSMVESEDDDDDSDIDDKDINLKLANLGETQVGGAMVSQSGDIRLENTSMSVENSTVHLGNVIKYVSDVQVGKAASVVIDNRKIEYNCCKQHDKESCGCDPSPARAENHGLLRKVQEFLRNQYTCRLANIHPLPWCADFSLNLDDCYTTLQLVGCDRLAGKAVNQSVSLEQILDKPNDTGTSKCRVLIEGSPGYGKTTLSLRLASDWASGKPYLARFSLVFWIELRDFHASDLKSYIFQELYPQERNESTELLWNYIKDDPEQILFILDGLDELQRERRGAIDVLLKGNLLDKASVVVTSRLIPSDNAVLQYFNRRIVIRGFSEEQIEHFVNNYFRIRQNPQQAAKLMSFLSGQLSCGRYLAACPLTCLLLCVLFDDEGERLLRKITDVYKSLIGCLIRRAARPPNPAVSQRTYDRALRDFGRLCLTLLAEDVVTISAERLRQALKPGTIDLLLKLGLLVRVHSIPERIQKDIRYQPLHKSFMEYLAGYYLSWHVSKAQHGDLSANDKLMRDLNLLDAIKQEHLHLLLKFTVGLLAENAGPVFRLLSGFTLPDFTLFELLHEAGQTPENIRALSSILDNDCIIVQSNQMELDGWAGLLADAECPIRCLKFQWVDNPHDNGALDRFFTALQANTSVVCLAICASYGFMPTESERVDMAIFSASALKKSQLRHLSLELTGDEWSIPFSKALSQTLHSRTVAPSLSSLNLAINLATGQLESLCQGILRCGHIKNLALPKLSCGKEGYQHLANLVERGTFLQQLSVSLNVFKQLPPPECAVRGLQGSPEDMQNLVPFVTHAVRLQTRSSNDTVETNAIEECLQTSEDGNTTSTGIDYRRNVSVTSLQSADTIPPYTVQNGLRHPGVVASGILGLDNSSSGGCHSSETHDSGFHFLFQSLKSSSCRLERLDLSGCFVELADLVCLGDALEQNSSLQCLRLPNLHSFSHALQILSRLRSDTGLRWIDLSSKHVHLDDNSILLLIRALSSTTTLRSLALAGWSFTTTDLEVMRTVNGYLKTSTIQELNLSNCKIRLEVPRSAPAYSFPCLLIAALQRMDQDRSANSINSSMGSSSVSLSSSSTSSSSSSHSLPPSGASQGISASRTSLDSKTSKLGIRSAIRTGPWPNLVGLSLARTVVTLKVEGEETLRVFQGPSLLTYLYGLRRLTELSVSMKSRLPGQQISEEELDDHASKRFFGLVHRRLRKTIERLQFSSVSVKWSRPKQTSFWIARKLRECEKLTCVTLNFLQYKTTAAPTHPGQLKTFRNAHDSIHWLLDALISGLPQLRELNIQGIELTPTQAANVGYRIRDKWRGFTLRIETRKMSDVAVSALMQSLAQCSKLIAEYAGGTKGTVLVQRVPNLCGLLRSLLIKSDSPAHFPALGEAEEKPGDVDDGIAELRTNLMPGKWNAALTGASAFGQSILQAHLWDYSFSLT